MERDRRGGRSTGARKDAARKKVTLKQVAAHLGLSPATVSLVLNRSPVADSIPPETHERVFAAARELGYRPNLVARSLRSRRTLSIGVLVPEISEGYAAGVLSGVEDHLQNAGYFCLLASHRSRPDLLEEYTRLLQDRLVEGFIMVSTPIREAPGLPAVAVASHEHLEGVINVVIDHDRAAQLALSHLAELGHRRIAFFKGHEHTTDAEDRWRSIVEVAGSLDLEVAAERTLQLGSDEVAESFSPQEGYQEGYAFGRELLERTGGDFTALFAFNDVSAIGAMRAFHDAGLRIPQDVSVVGFDDIVGAGYQNPGLTTIRQPLRKMGETAGQILLERLSGDGHRHADEVTVEPELVVRESTGPAPGGAERDGGRHAAGPG